MLPLENRMQIFFLSSTHWDREWYLPFQAMRFQLIETMDEIIDVLEQQPDFRLFCMDGQTIVLEDYAAGVPEENVRRLKALIANGRVLVGPWYVMPDERLLSGESLIHNFLRGRKVAAQWGADPWKFGYLCDIFGHIAQMPQILQGFGISASYLGRGLGEETWRGPFRWQAPDGSEVIGYLDCYANFTLHVTRRYGTPDYGYVLETEIRSLAEDSRAPVLVLADAFDHAPINPHTNCILEDIRRLLPDADVRHESLEALAEAVEPYRESLPVVRGPLVQTTRDKKEKPRLVTNSLSSYYPLKYRNDHCEFLLEKLVSPLYTAACQRGMKERPELYAMCWKYLLQNQPHDSICGCSVDQVHIDMGYRYDQVESIADELLQRACSCLWEDSSNPEPCLAVFNPLTYDWQGPVRLQIPFPQDYETQAAEPAGYSPRNSFRLWDADGEEIPYQLHGIRRGVTKRLSGQQHATVDLYDLSMGLRLPPMSETRVCIRPDNKPVRFAAGSMCFGPDWCDNGRIRLRVAPEGTLMLTDHATGRVYEGLNRYVCSGEDGNGWFHDAPVGDTLRMAGAALCVERTAAGPVQVTFRIVQELKLPVYRQSPQETALRITTDVTVWAGERYVQVDATVENNAADFRAQVLFPTQMPFERYYTGQSFACVERLKGQQTKTLCWDEPDPLEKDMQGILFGRSEEGGFAFINPEGLHEGGVTADGMVAVTLLRSFSRAYLVDQPETAKLKGTHQFRWAILPLTGDERYDRLLKLREQLAVKPPFAVRSGEACWGKPFIRVDGDNLMTSILKMPEDGTAGTLILRIWNASDQTAEGTITTDFALAGASRTAMDETGGSPLETGDRSLAVAVKPWEIITLRLYRKE